MSEPSVNLNHVALLGIDVGFSKSRPTTGITWSKNGDFGAARTHADWDRRRQHIPASTQFSVIAIDGPLVPVGSDDSLDRLCERLFIRGAFQTRCKPGMSNHGYGKDLRRAAAETAIGYGSSLSHEVQGSQLFRDSIRKFNAISAIIQSMPSLLKNILLRISASLSSLDQLKTSM